MWRGLKEGLNGGLIQNFGSEGRSLLEWGLIDKGAY